MAAHPSNVFCKLIGGSVTDQVVRWIERTVLTINFPGASSKSKMRPPRLTSKCNLKPKIAIFLLATLPKSAP